MDSAEFRVFSTALELKLTVTREEGQVTCLEYMPYSGQFVVSTSDLMLSVYDESTGFLATPQRIDVEFYVRCEREREREREWV